MSNSSDTEGTAQNEPIGFQSILTTIDTNIEPPIMTNEVISLLRSCISKQPLDMRQHTSYSTG